MKFSLFFNRYASKGYDKHFDRDKGRLTIVAKASLDSEKIEIDDQGISVRNERIDFSDITGYSHTVIELKDLIHLKASQEAREGKVIQFKLETLTSMIPIQSSYDFGLHLEYILKTLIQLKHNKDRYDKGLAPTYEYFCETCGIPKPRWQGELCAHCGGALTKIA